MSAPSPEFANIMSIFQDEDNQDRLIKKYKISKASKNETFHEFLHKILKQHFKHVQQVWDGEASDEMQRISFKKLFPNSEILSLFLRDEPHLIFIDLLSEICEIENIEIEGEDILYKQIDFPKPRDLAKAIQMYFNQVTYSILKANDLISTKSKAYFEPLLKKWLRQNDVAQHDSQGNEKELNLEAFGVNLFFENDGNSMFKVTVEFASGDNVNTDPK